MGLKKKTIRFSVAYLFYCWVIVPFFEDLIPVMAYLTMPIDEEYMWIVLKPWRFLIDIGGYGFL